jgi:molybdate transport system ATP-binding protein
MSLQINLRKQLNNFDIDIDFTCPEGKMIVMIGPSGGGKTTIIRMIAGLEIPDEGRNVYRGESWYDSARHICLPPQDRCLGYVFQEYTLFPFAVTLYEKTAGEGVRVFLDTEKLKAWDEVNGWFW